MNTEPSVAFAPVGVMASEQAWGKDWQVSKGGWFSRVGTVHPSNTCWELCFLPVCQGPPSDPDEDSGGVRRDLEPEAGKGKLGSIAYKL